MALLGLRHKLALGGRASVKMFADFIDARTYAALALYRPLGAVFLLCAKRHRTVVFTKHWNNSKQSSHNWALF